MEDDRYTLEFMEKVKKVKSAEELQAAARQFGMEITEEQAQAYFGYFHIPIGEQNTEELSDQELENISGGGCCSLPRKMRKIPLSTSSAFITV